MNISIALLIFTKCVRKFIDVEKHEEEWALDVHPSCSLIIILPKCQKEGFSHQLHTQAEAI